MSSCLVIFSSYCSFSKNEYKHNSESNLLKWQVNELPSESIVLAFSENGKYNGNKHMTSLSSASTMLLVSIIEEN